MQIKRPAIGRLLAAGQVVIHNQVGNLEVWQRVQVRTSSFESGTRQVTMRCKMYAATRTAGNWTAYHRLAVLQVVNAGQLAIQNRHHVQHE